MSVLYKHEERKYHPVEEKVALISGAANGIGAAIFKELVKKGHKKFALVG